MAQAQDNSNHFILHNLYPDLNSILSKRNITVKMLSKNALFVIDTNSLLAPYSAGKKDIEQIKNVYKRLIKEDRLFVPAHVLREFAKNRSTKISELYTSIDNMLSTIAYAKQIEYPILGDLESYKNVNKVAQEIKDKINEYKKHIEELKSKITDWNWADPVTTLYSDTFNESVVIDTELKEEDLLQKYDHRIKYNIPPGNKDKGKGENAIGDLIIWMSILELGLKKKKDIIFVSNDEKNDWMVKGNSKAISTRFELVDEFYRHTEGGNFSCITFSDFLESQGLSDIKFTITVPFDVDIDHVYPARKSSVVSLNYLSKCIEEFLLVGNKESEVFIDDDAFEYHIQKFLNSSFDEFMASFGNDEERSRRYYGSFISLLYDIRSLNSEIKYQFYRAKVDTTVQQRKLVVLATNFANEYRSFLTKA